MAATTGGNGGVVDPGSICWASPADQAGQIGNLLSRVSLLESILNQLLGVNISTLNVSDLTTDLGNMIGGSLTLPQTGDGSYPNAPGDFSGTIISGNVITTWENGVVSFQVTPGSGVTSQVLRFGSYAYNESDIPTSPIVMNPSETIHSPDILCTTTHLVVQNSGNYFVTLSSFPYRITGSSGIAYQSGVSLSNVLGGYLVEVMGGFVSGVPTYRDTKGVSTILSLSAGDTLYMGTAKLTSGVQVIMSAELLLCRISS